MFILAETKRRAAGREFRARGFFETGMRDIAAASDLSPANLYNYFRGKREILFFCQDTALDRLLDPDYDSVTLNTLRKAATAVGRQLRLELV